MGYERFENLCEIKGVKPSHVSKATGVATATLSSWKKGKYTPKSDKLQKIADYLDVPLEYLADEESDEKKVLGRDFNDMFFEGQALGAYLKEIGWEVKFISNGSPAPYYIFKNGSISMNVSTMDYDVLNESVREYCMEKIFEMVKRSASPIKLAAARPNANPNAGDSDSPEDDLSKLEDGK